MAAKGVPGAAKPLSQMKGPNRGRGDDDEVSSDDEADDEADARENQKKRKAEGAGVPEYFADALKALGHKGSTPIQRECWPHACAGRDLLGVAPPGSGKTLAYLLPAVEFALRDARDFPAGRRARRGEPAGEPRALVVAPTRELARCRSSPSAASSGGPRPCGASACTAARARRTGGAARAALRPGAAGGWHARQAGRRAGERRAAPAPRAHAGHRRGGPHAGAGVRGAARGVT